jgi:two-component system CheB/CheR fusion protein
VERLDRDASNRAVVSAAIAAVHSLGLRALGEGVESEAEVRELRALRCDLGQGYYWWEPRDADAVSELLTESFAPPET